MNEANNIINRTHNAIAVNEDDQIKSISNLSKGEKKH